MVKLIIVRFSELKFSSSSVESEIKKQKQLMIIVLYIHAVASKLTEIELKIYKLKNQNISIYPPPAVLPVTSGAGESDPDKQ